MKNKFLVLVFFLSIATAVASAGCTLQLHGYDTMGDGWEDSSISIEINNETVVDSWYVQNRNHEYIEFIMEAGHMLIVIEAGADAQDNFFRVTDQDGYYIWSPIVFENVSYWIEISCDLQDTYAKKYSITGFLNDEPVCHNGYIDDCNMGCDSINPEFSVLNCGEVVCGTLGSYTSQGIIHQDIDWYTVRVDHYADFYLSITSSFPGTVSMFKMISCESLTLIDEVNPPHRAAIDINDLSPGRYAIRVCLDDRWFFACSETNQYSLSLTCCNEYYTNPLWINEMACEANYVDVTNGGCFSETEAMQSIPLSSSIAGSAGFHATDDGPEKDEDWYSFQIYDSIHPVIYAHSESPSIFNLLSGDCSNYDQVFGLETVPCDIQMLDPGFELIPGNYMMQVKAAGMRGIDCHSNYRFNIYVGEQGENVNIPVPIDVAVFKDHPDRVIAITGDTRHGFNHQNGVSYGLPYDLSASEWTGKIVPVEDIHLRFETYLTNWPTRLIVTESWPPQQVWFSDEYRGYDRGGFDSLLFHSGVEYFVFIDGDSNQVGHFELNISDSAKNTELLNLSINIDRYYIDSGSDLEITSRVTNPFNEAMRLKKCICFECNGQIWFLPDFTSELMVTDIEVAPGKTDTIEFSHNMVYDIDERIYFHVYMALLEIDTTNGITFRSPVASECFALVPHTEG